MKGLNENVGADDIKRIAGVKHVISATVDEDSIKNVCTGTGRIKLRLNPTEDLDVVKLQFLKAGYGVQEHSDETNKKASFTKA